MRIYVYTILIFCSINIYGTVSSFENNIELYGIEKLSDQAMVSSLNGDDYFFGIENNKIIGKLKKIDSNIFSDYILDFSFHSFDNVIEVESIRFSNDRDYLFIICEYDGISSIHVFNFNNDNILTYNEALYLEFNKDEYITFFNILNGKNDNAEIIIGINDNIKHFSFNNNFVNQFYSIASELCSNSKINKFLQNKSINKYFVISTYNTINFKNELWVGSFGDDLVSIIKIEDIIDFQNLEYEIINNSLIYSISNNQYKQYLNINFEKMDYTTVILNIKNLNHCYFEIDDEKIYCIFDNNNYVTYPNLKKVEDRLLINTLPNLLYKYSDNLITFNENNRLIINPIEAVKNKVETSFTLNSGKIFNNFILTEEKKNNSYLINLLYIYDSEIIKLNEYDYITDRINFDDMFLVGSFINIDKSPLYLSLKDKLIFESEEQPFQLGEYVLYKINSKSYIGFGEISK